MNEFKMLNFSTEYECCGSLNYTLRTCACFNDIFNHIEDDFKIEYKIYLQSNTALLERKDNNYCLLNANEVINHMNICKRIYPMSFSLNTSNGPSWCLKMKLSNVPALFHKYALSWARYTYEFPYNVMLADAVKLQKEFPFLQRSFLFNVVANSFNRKVYNIHAIGDDFLHKNITVKELRKKIATARRLDNIYSYIDDSNLKRLEYHYHLDKWLNNYETVRRRVYIYNIGLLI